MTKELYFVNENGQMEINFESLELRTNSLFVEKVKKALELNNMQIVEVDTFEFVTVVITNGASLIELNYFPSIDFISEKETTLYDARRHMAFMEGVKNNED